MKITIELEKDRNLSIDMKLGKDSERRGFMPVREYVHGGIPLKTAKGLENKLHTGTTEVDESKAPKAFEGAAKDITTQEEHPVRKTLCIVKCPKCGKVSFIPLPVQDGKVKLSKPMICLSCGTELDLSDLHPCEAKCPNCGSGVWGYVAGTKDIEITCKNCGSPVDLLYNHTDNEFRSPNLFGPRGK